MTDEAWRVALDKHEADRYAHAEARHQTINDAAAIQLSIEHRFVKLEALLAEQGDAVVRRLDDHEKFQQRLMGGLIVISALLGSGLVASAVAYFLKP